MVHTKKRKEAWALLSEDRPFTYTEAEELCKAVLSSKSGFTSFWNDIKRVKLIVQRQGFVAVKVPGAAEKTPDQQQREIKNNNLGTKPTTEPTSDDQTETAFPSVAKTDQTETGLVAG